MERRSFLGALGGLGAALFGGKPQIDTDDLFDTIRGVPCVPVDTWINRMKPYMWDGDYPDGRLTSLFLDCFPIRYTAAAVADAIAALPPKYPVYEVPIGFNPGTCRVKRGADGLSRSRRIPQWYVVNPRLADHRGGRWLVVDLQCVRPEVPPELRCLTAESTDKLLSYLTADGAHRGEHPWPAHWGVTGMCSDVWPVGSGNPKVFGDGEEVSADGLTVTRMEINNFRMLASAPFASPIPLHYVWLGHAATKWVYAGTVGGASHGWVASLEHPCHPLLQVPEHVDSYYARDYRNAVAGKRT